VNLKVLLPSGVLLDRACAQVTAHGLEGSFTLLPRHQDLAAALDPGILSWEDPEGVEGLAAHHRGVLVKKGDQVLVSVRDGTTGRDLDQLEKVVRERYLVLREQELQARTSMAKLEARFVRGLLEIEHG
jgi:F-type H+-transporting ATPase subunit epsilon